MFSHGPHRCRQLDLSVDSQDLPMHAVGAQPAPGHSGQVRDLSDGQHVGTQAHPSHGVKVNWLCPSIQNSVEIARHATSVSICSSLPGIEASSLRVYGCRGLVKISSEVAASTSSPSFITQT